MPCAQEFTTALNQLQQIESTIREHLNSEQEAEHLAVKVERRLREHERKNSEYADVCKRKAEEAEEELKKEEWEEILHLAHRFSSCKPCSSMFINNHQHSI